MTRPGSRSWRTGFYKEVYVKSPVAHGVRAVITARGHLVEARGRLDNTIRGLCASLRIEYVDPQGNILTMPFDQSPSQNVVGAETATLSIDAPGAAAEPSEADTFALSFDAKKGALNR
jgi:transposase